MWCGRGWGERGEVKWSVATSCVVDVQEVGRVGVAAWDRRNGGIYHDAAGMHGPQGKMGQIVGR